MCTDIPRLGVPERLNKRRDGLNTTRTVKGGFGSPPRYPYNAPSSLAIRIPT